MTPLHKCGLGEQVAQARLFASLTIDDLAKHTKISEKYLTALEREDWSSLPADVFLRGYVRILAKTLQANPDDWTNLLPTQTESCAGTPTALNEKPAITSPTFLNKKTLLWLGLFFLTAGILFFVIKTRKWTDVKTSQESIQTESVSPTSLANVAEPVIQKGQSLAPLLADVAAPQPTTAFYNVTTKDVKLAISSPTHVWIKVDENAWVQKSVTPGLYEIVFDRQVLVKLSDILKAKIILAGKPALSVAREFKISLKPQDSGAKL